MKIAYCILNTWYAGGLTRVLANKANYLAEHGHEVFVITTDQFDKGHYYPMSEKITFIDLNIAYVGYDHFPVHKKGFAVGKKIYQHRRELKKTLYQIKPDVTVSLFGKEAFFLPSIKDGSKKVLEAHTSRPSWLDSRKGRGKIGELQNWMDIQVAKRFDKFVVLTEEDKPYWDNLNNVVTIPNANTFETDNKASLNNKVAIAAGRYGYPKNLDALVYVWQKVAEKHPDWKLHVRGNGLELLAPLVEQMQMSSYIDMRPSSDMLNEFLSSSIFLLTSEFEGLPLVLLEAQACGVPGVCYTCKCGPRDVINDGENGFLIPEGDVQAMADKICVLIENEELRKQMGENAKRLSERFSEETIMKRWITLFEELTQK